MASAFPTAWRVLRTSQDPKFLVKGYDLAVTLYGPQSRFAVYEVRTLDAERLPSIAYRVHDAERVTDAEVRAGKAAPAIAHGLTWDQVEEVVRSLIGAG
jgi:hypothetical protein